MTMIASTAPVSASGVGGDIAAVLLTDPAALLPAADTAAADWEPEPLFAVNPLWSGMAQAARALRRQAGPAAHTLFFAGTETLGVIWTNGQMEFRREQGLDRLAADVALDAATLGLVGAAYTTHVAAVMGQTLTDLYGLTFRAVAYTDPATAPTEAALLRNGTLRGVSLTQAA